MIHYHVFVEGLASALTNQDCQQMHPNFADVDQW